MRSFFSRLQAFFHIPSRETMFQVTERMGVIERAVFFLLFALLAGSSLILLYKLNDLFSKEIPTDGGTVVEGVIGYPRYINPLLPVTDSGRDLTELIYSGLFKPEADGTLTPDLAKEYNISEDGLVYTITLKDNIHFHDNTPVTAYDVEFTIKKAIDPVLQSPRAPNWIGVEVKALSEKQIQFTLKNKYAPFLENLTLGILPEHLWKNVASDAFLFSQLNFEPIGSGPFKIKRIERDEAGLPLFYELEPFAKYALGKPYINRLIIKFYSPERLIEAFREEEINSISAISPEEALMLKKEGAHILQAPLPRIFALFFNQNEAQVLANKEVRLALNEAVDKQRIIDEVLGGFGTPAEGPLPPQFSSLEKLGGVGKSKEERLTSAREILEKAGWEKNESGIYSKGDKSVTTLSFSLATANLPELKKVAEIIKDDFEELGARVSLKIFDRSDLQQNVIAPRKYDTILFGEVIGRDLDLFAFWHSSERNYPGLNLALYTNAKVDKLLGEARNMTEAEERKAKYVEIEKEIINDAPAIFLYSPDFIYVVPEELKGVSINGIVAPHERFLNAYKWHIETEKVWSFLQNKLTN